jgi:RNA polymerase sigma-70 factor (ECF subfamily)
MDRQLDRRLRDLMVAYQAGEYGAFEHLYRELSRPVRARVRSGVRDAGRVEDLAQEVFLQLHRARRTYDPGHPVLPWVFAITRHVVQTDRRTVARRPQLVAEAAMPQPAGRAEAHAFIDGEPVREALAQLAPERRHALLLHHVGGWSFRDIARRFGIRESAAKLRSSRGMQQLRHLLKK